MQPLFKIPRFNIRCTVKRCYGCGSLDFPYPGISKKTLDLMEKRYNRLLGSKSKSLLKQYLTPKLFHKLKQVTTKSYTSGINDCIQSGLIHLDSEVGVYAADPECYKLFAMLFEPIIEKRHKYKIKGDHACTEFGDHTKFKNIDPRIDFILSTRMRLSRNVKNYPFAPKMTQEHYKTMEDYMIKTFSVARGDLKGWYHPLDVTFRSKKDSWIKDHLFKDANRFMEAGNICNYAPMGRGFYHNLRYDFTVWINYDEHLRIVSMNQGGDFGGVYKRLIEGHEFIGTYVPFVRENCLGYLMCNPENVGTGLRVSVLIKLIHLPNDEQLFESVLKKYDLQVRGTYGYGTDVIRGVYDISNRRYLGVNEFHTVKTVYDGVQEIIKMEKCCCRNKTI